MTYFTSYSKEIKIKNNIKVLLKEIIIIAEKAKQGKNILGIIENNRVVNEEAEKVAKRYESKGYNFEKKVLQKVNEYLQQILESYFIVGSGYYDWTSGNDNFKNIVSNLLHNTKQEVLEIELEKYDDKDFCITVIE